MKRPVLMAALAAAGLAVSGAPAGAGLIPTTAVFFTPPADGVLTFTYEGFSASDTDQMAFASNGDVLFPNQVAEVGATVHQTVVAGQTYQLNLDDASAGNAWSSNPASNSDGEAHLASTSTFSDFHIGATAPVPVNTSCGLISGCYFGWEDRPGPGADRDFNDLVFAVQFTPATPSSRSVTPDPVSEPGTLALLCAGLLGLGFLPRRSGAARRAD